MCTLIRKVTRGIVSPARKTVSNILGLTMFCLVLLISLLGCVVAAPGGGTKMCPFCDKVKDPNLCNLIMKCGHGEGTCFVKVDYIAGEYLYSKGCKHECVDQRASLIIGKRGPHEPHVSHTQVCQKCCHTHSPTYECDGCGEYVSPLTLPTTTPIPVTKAPTVTSAPAVTSSPVTPCMDHEGDGFLCSDYDMYNFCNASNTLAHKLAVDRCPNHCGLCDAFGNFKVTPSPATTQSVMTDSPTMSMSTNVQIVSVNVTTCVDKEDQGFSCQQWASYGFCSDGTGTGHAIAVERCSKYCGFCS